MTNKYLEKVALNAFKARSMAKTVGVIPDHTSAWKYAVRNLRDSRGNALQGKALHEARAKLGDIDNNGFRHMQRTSDQWGGTQGKEFSTAINRKGRIVDDIVEGDAHIVDRAGGAEHHNVHTHPDTYLAMLNRDLGNRFKHNPHRIAEPSGASHLRTVFHKETPHMYKEVRNIPDNATAARKLRQKAGLTSDPSRKSLLDRMSAIKSEMAEEGVKHYFKNPTSPLRGDTKFMAGKLAVRDESHLERIVSPSTNTLSVNKFRPQGVRTVYFDHTPRKAK